MEIAKRKQSILLVDDDRISLGMARLNLDEERFDVIATVSVSEALSHLDRCTFDVISADYHMPEMDGLEFLGRATEIQPDASALLLTADTRICPTEQSVSVLFKPVDPRELQKIFIQLARMSEMKRTVSRMSQQTRRLFSRMSPTYR